MASRDTLTDLFLPLLSCEMYIEILSSISGKIYVGNVDKIEFHEDENGVFDSIDITYGDSLFVVWVDDIDEILQTDEDFIGEDEEYDEDFKFSFGLSFDNGMCVYFYINVNDYDE